jgi:hypothetical protein
MLNIPSGMLTDIAYRKLIVRLEEFGNKPNEKHKQALKAILRTYSDMATGGRTGRWAFPLFTGGGKTQSIVAWLQAAHRITSQAGGVVSVSVCASQVEALCELKRDLVEAGIPKDMIALVHSYDALPEGESITSPTIAAKKKYASEPSTPFDLVDSRPILLLTHNRVKGKGGIEQFLQFNGQPRDLMVWDESLIKSEGKSLSYVIINSGLRWWQARYCHSGAPSPMHARALEYVEKALGILQEELDRQGTNPNGDPQILHLPRLTADEVRQYKEVFGGTGVTEQVRELLEVSQQDLRVFKPASEPGGYLTYDILVPPELENIVILDASHNIRELAHIDTGINELKTFPETRDLVSYQDVEVRQIKHAGGRGAIENAFALKKVDGMTPLVREIVDYVKALPKDEAVLFFTFKAKEKYKGTRKYLIDCADILKQALKKEGIDCEAKLQDGKDRFCWLTHGNETSTSKYRYCIHQIWAGVLYRSLSDIGSQIVGQRDDLKTAVPTKEQHTVCASEIGYRFHQGFGRGPCRVVKDGLAGRQTVLIVFQNRAYDVEGLVKSAMPGVHWGEYGTKHLSTGTKVAKISRKVAGYLKSLEEQGCRKISSVKLKRALHLQDENRDTATRSMQKALKIGDNWTLEGRSFVLMDAQHFGFKSPATN